MINIITSNKISGNKINQKDLQFVIVHFQLVEKYPFDQLKYTYLFKIYYQKNMKIDKSDYITSGDYEYQYIPISTIDEVIKNINDDICNQQLSVSDLENNNYDLTTITSCNDHEFNTSITKRLIKINTTNSSFHNYIVDLYTYMKCISIEKLANIIKSYINTDCVYSTDPMQFAYSIYCAFNGVR